MPCMRNTLSIRQLYYLHPLRQSDPIILWQMASKHTLLEKECGGAFKCINAS